MNRLRVGSAPVDAPGHRGDQQTSALDVSDAALARHHAYALFSQLYIHGLTPSVLPYVKAIPELARTVSSALAPDAAAADYYHLFGFNLFPYASAFVGEDSLLGGTVTESVSAAYADGGFCARTTFTADDHIGRQLAFMAFLCVCEAKACEQAHTVAARDAQRRQLRFMHAHMLNWLPPFAVALQRQKNRFFAALGDLTISFVNAHVAQLGGEKSSGRGYCAVHSPSEPAHRDGHLVLKDLADYLTTPYACGLALTRETISRLGREVQQPSGFGSRRDMLLTLLETAQRYGRLLHLLTALEVEAKVWQKSFATFATDYPLLESAALHWCQKAGSTRSYLARVQLQLER